MQIIRHLRLPGCRPCQGAETTVTARYTNVTQGWSVCRRSGTRQDRKCVTTRNDGTIEVIVTPSSAGQKPILEVLIN